MSANKRKRVLNAINRIPQNHLPTQIDYTPEMKKKIIRLLGIKENEVNETLDNHIYYLPLKDIRKIDKVNGIKYDIWGIGWDLILTEGFHIRHHPLLKSENFFEYNFPQPEDRLLYYIITKGKDLKNDYFLLSLQDFTLFERCWCLIGYENLMTSFYFRKKEIDYLLDGITEFNIELSKKIIKLGIVDGLRTGDDMGTQREIVISPEIWRRFFLKRYEKIWGIYKQKGLPVFHHSCGNILKIIPDMISIGLDVLNPIQPEAMSPEILVEKFGEQLSFMGGISTQTTLPFKTPQDVRQEVINRIEVLGKEQGFIISPSHEVTSDCSDENFLMLIKTFKEYKERSE